MTRIHQQMYLEFNQQNKNDKNNLHIKIQQKNYISNLLSCWRKHSLLQVHRPQMVETWNWFNSLIHDSHLSRVVLVGPSQFWLHLLNWFMKKKYWIRCAVKWINAWKRCEIGEFVACLDLFLFLLFWSYMFRFHFRLHLKDWKPCWTFWCIWHWILLVY